LSGIRIPDNSPGKPGVRKPDPAVTTGQQAGSLTDKRPQTEGQKPLKAARGNSTVAGTRNSAAGRTPNSAIPQKVAFGLQVNNLSSLLPSDSISQNQISQKTFETPAEQIPVRELYKQIAAGLGLPKDALSVALIAFCRFFSLSLKPELVGQLRREILASGKASSPKTAREKAAMESTVLAALIAMDKGVTLSPEALERYASFHFLPALPQVLALSDSTDGGENFKGQENPPEPEELQALAGEQTQKDDFLGFMNLLPGKNGRQWTVFSFSLRVKDTELTVFLRFLTRDPLSSAKDELVIADISSARRQWRWFLRKKDGKFLADIRVYPKCSHRSLVSLQREAGRFLGEGSGLLGNFGGFAEILVQNEDEAPSWVEDLSELYLPSICKDV
jgi:hypothetical protein